MTRGNHECYQSLVIIMLMIKLIIATLLALLYGATADSHKKLKETEVDWDYLGHLLENEDRLKELEAKIPENETSLESLHELLAEILPGIIDDDEDDKEGVQQTNQIPGGRAIGKGRNVGETNASLTTSSGTELPPHEGTSQDDHALEKAEGNINLESEGERAGVPSVPLHHLSKLGGTAALSDICDVDLYNNFIVPIYSRYKDGYTVQSSEQNLIDHVNMNKALRKESCYGYIPDPQNPNNSIVANFMECRQTNVTIKKGKCRCLDEGSKASSIHFRPQAEMEDRKCEHPIDILNRCDRKLWLRDVEGQLDDILNTIRGNKSDPTVVNNAYKDLVHLATRLKSQYLNVGLHKICFTEDFSMYCSRRRYCSCLRSPNFYFVRSKIIDRCVPVNGSICNALEPNADLCVNSKCLPLFPLNPPAGQQSSLGSSTSTSSSSTDSNTTAPSSPSPPTQSYPQACGGLLAWVSIPDTGCSLLHQQCVILQLIITACVLTFVIK